MIQWKLWPQVIKYEKKSKDIIKKEVLLVLYIHLHHAGEI